MREGEGGRGRADPKCEMQLSPSLDGARDGRGRGRERADGRAICRSNFAKHPVPPPLSPAFPFCLLPSNMFDLTKTTPSRHERSRGSLSPVSPRSLDVFGHDSELESKSLLYPN